MLAGMIETDLKTHLSRYLERSRDALLWKLDGLSEYDIRRPLVPTGTNLLGLIKHVSAVTADYLGGCFDRPLPEPPSWMAQDAGPNADLYATADESRDEIIAFWHRAWAHAEATVEALPLDAPGRVSWWGERGQVTLGQILVHLIAENDRHAGHADIVRELIDGAAGLRPGVSNLPGGDDPDFWPAYHDKLESIAARFAE
jgi:uncharacterized damage-inducible protein DinB